MPTPRMPGVYVEEISAFPTAIVSAATSEPAFIGYTRKAEYRETSQWNTPVQITGMADFEEIFGGPPAVTFEVMAAVDPAVADVVAPDTSKAYALTPTSAERSLLHASLQLYFLNGGGPCWIVSVGPFGAPDAAELAAGLATLTPDTPAAIIVIPDAVLLPPEDCSRLQQQMLQHCARTRRVAILDVWGGARARNDADGDPVAAFRDGLGDKDLKFGAAYYPWLQTSLVAPRDIALSAFTGDAAPDFAPLVPNARGALQLQAAAARRLNLLPPGGAIAGVYAAMDLQRGVWKAPANIALAHVTAPTVRIDDMDQADLNTPASGRAVNAIRAFPGKGTLVWGGRTLAGNDNEWRYVSTRRLMNMVELSCAAALEPLVFEPNTPATWARARGMIASFLTTLWRQGGLAGANPQDAFVVRIGLNETMTAADVQAGRLRAEILLAVVRPAEFIALRLEQQLTAAAE